MSKQVVYNGENQDYSQIQRPTISIADGGHYPQEYNSTFIEGSPFGPYSGKAAGVVRKKKK